MVAELKQFVEIQLCEPTCWKDGNSLCNSMRSSKKLLDLIRQAAKEEAKHGAKLRLISHYSMRRPEIAQAITNC
jgi:hypothetical protein